MNTNCPAWVHVFHEIDSSITRIVSMPEAWTVIGVHTRRCLLCGFPYSIHYVVDENEIIITAIAHLHRNPQYYENGIV